MTVLSEWSWWTLAVGAAGVVVLAVIALWWEWRNKRR